MAEKVADGVVRAALTPSTTRSVAPGLPRPLALLLAAACGLSVANVYFAHPLLDAMARDLAIAPAAVGGVVTLTQVGYAVGLVFLVPLGDLLDRRRLVVGQIFLSALALAVVGLAPTAVVLMASLAAVGLLAVVVQVLVAFAAALAAPAERGRAVGVVTSGIVIGILTARFAAGLMADLASWRAVYLTSAGLTLVTAGLLFRTLPRLPTDPAAPSYPALIGSVVALFRDEPLLRVRAVLAFFIFAAFNVLWAPLAFPLRGEPFSLSHTGVGLFGLAGLAGALGAGRAGRLADRGLGQRTTGLALCLMLAAWVPIALLNVSLWALAAGAVILDFAIQAVHVTSQSLLLAAWPEARSRMIGGYMASYSVGSAAGAVTSTAVYARGGWTGVCGLGAAISLTALAFWAATRGADRREGQECPFGNSEHSQEAPSPG